jgi:hypothetical protein
VHVDGAKNNRINVPPAGTPLIFSNQMRHYHRFSELIASSGRQFFGEPQILSAYWLLAEQLKIIARL